MRASGRDWFWEHAEHKTLEYKCILSRKKKSEVFWAAELYFRGSWTWGNGTYYRKSLCFLSKWYTVVRKSNFQKSSPDIPMSYVLHQEWFSDHKTTFLGSWSYQKVDFDVFVLQIPSNLAWARSSHQLKWPGFPNISNLVRLENQAQILKTLQIFFLAQYTSILQGFMLNMFLESISTARPHFLCKSWHLRTFFWRSFHIATL